MPKRNRSEQYLCAEAEGVAVIDVVVVVAAQIVVAENADGDVFFDKVVGFCLCPPGVGVGAVQSEVVTDTRIYRIFAAGLVETVEPGIFHRAVSIIDPAVGRKRGVRHPAVLQVIAQFDVGADFLVPSFVVAAMTVPAFRVKGVVGSADLSQPVAVLHVVFGADRIVEVVIVVVFLIGKAFKIELVADFRNNGEIVGNTISDFFGCAEILSGAGVVFQRGALILQGSGLTIPFPRPAGTSGQ